jgi:hypothetical protein
MTYLPNTTTAWTPAIKARCADLCGDVGDPPCWDLPNLTSDCPPDIQPCAECLAYQPSQDAK